MQSNGLHKTSEGHCDDGTPLRVARIMARVMASVAVGVVLASLVSACASTPRFVGPDDRGQRISEARGLAARGQAAFKARDYDQAISLTQQAVTTYPEFGAAWNNLGLAFMQRGKETDYVAAQQAFQRAAGLLPTDPTPYRNLGMLYQARGFEEEALRNYEQALTISDYDIESLRGATQSIKLLRRADPLTLERLKRAQMIETDPAWLEIIKRERIRVQNELDERARG